MDQLRTAFFVSDGTGITAETLGHSLLTQFDSLKVRQERIPFVDTEFKAKKVVKRINEAGVSSGDRPIVVNTIVDPKLRAIVATSNALILDLFEEFLGRLEMELGAAPVQKVGQAHGMVDFNAYEERIDATNFALSHDDGVDLNYRKADLILVGVSRSGKTPTCLYMALHYRVKAANYPLTPDDLDSERLPKSLRPVKNKLFGLTIDPVRLQQIREQRRPGSSYASEAQCKKEVRQAESMFRHERIPFLNTTRTSIEEIASKVMLKLGMNRELF